MSTAGTPEKKSSGKETMLRLVRKSMSFTSSSFRRGNGSSSSLLDTGDLSTSGVLPPLSLASLKKDSSGFSSKLKRGMKKAFSVKKSSTAGSLATADVPESSLPSLGSAQSGIPSAGFNQDVSKSFSKNLKQGLKKALGGKRTSMADSAATVDTVESSAPSVDSVASDLPTPTFHQVLKGSVDITADGEVRHTKTSPHSSPLAPKSRTPSREFSREHSLSSIEDQIRPAMKPAAAATGETLTMPAAVQQYTDLSPTGSVEVYPPVMEEDDSALVTILEEGTGATNIPTLATTEDAAHKAPCLDVLSQDDSSLPNQDSLSGDVARLLYEESSSSESLASNLSKDGVATLDLANLRSVSSDDGSFKDYSSSFGPSTPSLGSPGPPQLSGYAMQSIAGFTLEDLSQDKKKDIAVRVHVQQQKLPLLRIVFGGAALVLALGLGATVNRVHRRKGYH